MFHFIIYNFYFTCTVYVYIRMYTCIVTCIVTTEYQNYLNKFRDKIFVIQNVQQRSKYLVKIGKLSFLAVIDQTIL